MDDQFLHQLRREPPAAFAARLKWQLDRPAPPRAAPIRLLLLLAIVGTAFALVSPPARRMFADLFERQASNPDAKDTPAAVAPGLSGAAPRAPAAVLARRESVIPPSLAPRPTAAENLSGSHPITADDPPIAGTSLRSNSVVSQYAGAGGVPPTPQMAAVTAVATRQGLFRVLSFVTQPLRLMQQGRIPIDFELARTSANRVAKLSSMIPEVFATDTRAFDVNSRALDGIWTQDGDFRSRAEQLIAAADALDRAVALRDDAATLNAIGQVEMACDACHDTHRKN